MDITLWTCNIVMIEDRIGRPGSLCFVQTNTGHAVTVRITAQSNGPKNGRRMFRQASASRAREIPTATLCNIGS